MVRLDQHILPSLGAYRTEAVIKPPMSKIADVFGRYESFSIAVLLYVVGYIQQAGSS